MTLSEFDDLSDDELRARLEARIANLPGSGSRIFALGVDELVEHRDDYAERLCEVLD